MAVSGHWHYFLILLFLTFLSSPFFFLYLPPIAIEYEMYFFFCVEIFSKNDDKYSKENM